MMKDHTQPLKTKAPNAAVTTKELLALLATIQKAEDEASQLRKSLGDTNLASSSKKPSLNEWERLEAKVKDIIELNKKLYNDKLLALASIQNLKKQQQAEIIDIRKYAISDTLMRLLPALDNFETAFKNQTDLARADKNFLVGFEMIYKIIKEALKKAKVTKISVAPGDNFNHDYHDAVDTTNASDYAPGSIVEILQPGYLLEDRVLRHAMVIVKQEPHQPTKTTNNTTINKKIY